FAASVANAESLAALARSSAPSAANRPALWEPPNPSPSKSTAAAAEAAASTSRIRVLPFNASQIRAGGGTGSDRTYARTDEGAAANKLRRRRHGSMEKGEANGRSTTREREIAVGRRSRHAACSGGCGCGSRAQGTGDGASRRSSGCTQSYAAPGWGRHRHRPDRHLRVQVAGGRQQDGADH